MRTRWTVEKEALNRPFFAGRDRQNAVGQIDVFLTLGHRNTPGDLFGQDPV